MIASWRRCRPVKQITGALIKSIENGENINDMDVFNPERAAKMLDLGDIEALIKSRSSHQPRYANAPLKTQPGQFNFVDFKATATACIWWLSKRVTCFLSAQIPAC